VRVGKLTLYDWKREYEQSEKKLLSLVPKKTRPKRVRQMTTDWRLVQFIINGVVERFNRTIQEEFINRNDEIYFDLDEFQVKLTGYLDW